MYDRILYPTDGSRGAKAALPHVRDIASTYDATVDVLYAIDTTEVGVGMVGHQNTESEPGMVGGHGRDDGPGMVGEQPMPEETREALEEQGEAVVEHVAEELEGIDTRTVVDSGDPYQVILDHAAEEGIDLVVMGTHGRTGADRYLLGSITEKVVRTSDVPVVTVRAEAEE